MNELSVTRTGDATVTPLRSNRIVPPASCTRVAAVSPLPKMRSTSSRFTTISLSGTRASVTKSPPKVQVPVPVSVTRELSYPSLDRNFSSAPSATSNVAEAGIAAMDWMTHVPLRIWIVSTEAPVAVADKMQSFPAPGSITYDLPPEIVELKQPGPESSNTMSLPNVTVPESCQETG